MKKIILASQSPWRKKLLSWLELPFEVVVSDFDESSVNIKDPEELVKTLALKKAEVVVDALRSSGFSHKTRSTQDDSADMKSLSTESSVVIGADTVIVIRRKNDELGIMNGENNKFEAIGKPKDIDDARRILKKLRGREHFVYTGVCVQDLESGKALSGVEETRMVFGDFSDEVLEAYLETGDSMGKAGAYQFLEIKDIFLQSFDGSVSGVIGLPVNRLVSMLAGVGVRVEGDIEKKMLSKIGYED